MQPLPPLDFGPEPDLAVQDVHRRVLVAHHWGQRAERNLCYYLREMERRRLYQELGFSDIFHYTHVSLGFDRRRTRTLLHLAETLERLPRVAAAFDAGEVGWTKVREIAPVATPENEDEWLDRARSLSSRELEQAVVRAGGRRERSEPRAEVVPAPSGEEVEITVRVPVAVFALWEETRSRMREVAGGAVTAAETFEFVCRDFLNTAYRELDVSSPFTLAMYVCKHCRKAEVSTPDGPLEVGRDELAAASCDARVLDLEREETGLPPPRSSQRTDVVPESIEPGEYERRLTSIVDLSERTGYMQMVRTAPRALRRFLLYRDRGKCQVPGCSRRLWTEAHHIVYFHRGGQTRGRNLVLVCSTHHRLIHEGHLQVTGTAPDRLVWRLRDGTPLTHVGRLEELLKKGRDRARRAVPCLRGPTWVVREGSEALSLTG